MFQFRASPLMARASRTDKGVRKGSIHIESNNFCCSHTLELGVKLWKFLVCNFYNILI